MRLAGVPHRGGQRLVRRRVRPEDRGDLRRLGGVGRNGVRVPLERPAQRIGRRQRHHQLHGLGIFLQHHLAVRRGQIVADGRCGIRFIDGAGQQAGAGSGKPADDEMTTRQNRHVYLLQWDETRSRAAYRIEGVSTTKYNL